MWRAVRSKLRAAPLTLSTYFREDEYLFILHHSSFIKYSPAICFPYRFANSLLSTFPINVLEIIHEDHEARGSIAEADAAYAISDDRIRLSDGSRPAITNAKGCPATATTTTSFTCGIS